MIAALEIAVNVAKASFTLGADWLPEGFEAAPAALRAAALKQLGTLAVAELRRQLRAGKDAHGGKLQAIRHRRPDGAQGPPLSPHQAGSRFQKWARFAVASGHVTVFWSHGWAKIVGAHAFPRARKGGWSLPVRDVVGLAPAGRRRVKAQLDTWWAGKAPRVVPASKPTPKPKRKPAVAALTRKYPYLGPYLEPRPTPKTGPKPRPRPRPTPPPPKPEPTTPAPVLPGRPIAERIAAAADAGSRVDRLAALQREVEAFKATQASLVAEAQRWHALGATPGFRPTPEQTAAYVRFREVYTQAQAEAKAMRQKIRAQALEVLKAPEPLAIRFEEPGRFQLYDEPLVPLGSDARTSLDEARAWLDQVVARGDHAGDLTTRVGQLSRGTYQGTRSFHYQDGIALAPIVPPKTVVHEFGHQLEESLGAVGDRAREFLKYRTAGEPAQDYNDVMSEGKYGPTERGRQDKFADAFGADQGWYAGKEYSHEATEIVAMGLERLYLDAPSFAKQDPEFCRFILGLLSGELR
jgi:hypothetical protein